MEAMEVAMVVVHHNRNNAVEGSGVVTSAMIITNHHGLIMIPSRGDALSNLITFVHGTFFAADESFVWFVAHNTFIHWLLTHTVFLCVARTGSAMPSEHLLAAEKGIS